MKADAPIAWYRFEESGGRVLVDSVAGRNGTLEGVTGWGELGIGGSKAFRFDGETTRALIAGTSFAFGGKAPFSFEVWLRAESVEDDAMRPILKTGSASGRAGGYSVFFRKTLGTFTQMDDADGSTTSGCAYGSAPTSGKYTHLVAAYDGEKMRLYLDGGLVGAGKGSADVGAAPDTVTVIGDTVGGISFKYEGLMDEVALYDKALPAARVALHFAAGAPP